MPLRLLFLVVMVVRAASADISWPNKTGPFGNGNARARDASGVPTSWSESTGENIAWKIPLDGLGHSTPVIGDGRIWLTTATDDGTRQFVYCIRESDGKVLHHKLLFENAEPEPLNNPVNSYASPSPVLTHDAVYVHFGTYGTARLHPETADVVWERRDINARHFRGPGSSPVLVDNLLVLTFDGIDEQFLTALDTRTGDTVWRTDRTTDFGDLGPDGKPKREGDLRKAYSTPAIASVDGVKQVISVGSRAAFGYDLMSGKERWTIRHDDYNAAARPLVYQDTVIMNTGSSKANLISVRLTKDTKGDLTGSSHVVWDRPQGNSRLCFPVLRDGRIYSLTDKGVATCLAADTSEELWKGRIGGNFVASPLIANNLVYVFSESGRTTLFEAGTRFKVVAENDLSEGGKASPAVANGALYLRSTHFLYKIATDASTGTR